MRYINYGQMHKISKMVNQLNCGEMLPDILAVFFRTTFLTIYTKGQIIIIIIIKKGETVTVKYINSKLYFPEIFEPNLYIFKMHEK